MPLNLVFRAIDLVWFTLFLSIFIGWPTPHLVFRPLTGSRAKSCTGSQNILTCVALQPSPGTPEMLLPLSPPTTAPTLLSCSYSVGVPLKSERFDETHDDNYDDDDLTLGDGDEHNMLQESGEWARRMRRPSAAKLVLFTSVGAKPPPTSRIH